MSDDAAASGDLQRLQEEFDSFQQSSKELEEELEKDLRRAEANATQAQKRVRELEELVAGATARSAEASAQVTALQTELSSLREVYEALLVRSRELEQDADLREEQQRRVEAELTRAREQLDRSLEGQTLTQTELEELRREALEGAERSREEMAELRQELDRFTPIKKRPASPVVDPRPDNDYDAQAAEVERLRAEVERLERSCQDLGLELEAARKATAAANAAANAAAFASPADGNSVASKPPLGACCSIS